jgi:two-component system invasion response regulator UvrY
MESTQRNFLIALADDHAMFNEGLTQIISGFGYEVVFSARNGKELIDWLQPSYLPDLVILDIKMPIMNGYETAHWLQINYPEIPVMALTMVDSDLSKGSLMKRGIRGILLKKMCASEIKRSIDSIVETGYFFPGRELASLRRPVPSRAPVPNRLMLTEKELQFLKLACKDLSYKEIADEMGISQRTVEKYRDSLFAKLGAKGRAGLVRYGIQNGLDTD